ncbi:MAG TPA: oxygenase MpaB family protein [Chitinophagales bacterium]|nr:oxygenase MpaB family protein [Chitinophagales bacterium]
MARFNAFEKIKALDPDKDHWEIVRLSAFYEFPWDFTRSLELALFRTFASPSISKILAKSREFENHTQKRYDDTDLILSEILEHGPASERGSAALAKMNFIHSHFNISNDDYLYVLSTFIFEPERWINKYGYRKLTNSELQAGYKVWQEIGAHMGIKDIPEKRETLEQFNIAYEKKYFVPSATNQSIATYTENLFLGWLLPKALYPVGRPFLHAIMDEPLLNAVGFKKPSAIIIKTVAAAMALRKAVVQLLPRRQKPAYRTAIPRKQTYPNGYEVKELGSKAYR